MVLSTTACSGTPSNLGLSDPNGKLITENVEIENTITENTLTEFITSEIYLEELVIAEDKITELLLGEETINEVLLCKTIYVPQDNIDEFATNSQTASLFGDDFDIAPVLKKVAVGTGVIVTLVVLRKVGVSEPIASVVTAAAEKSLQFAEGGAAIGSLFGGLTGAADEIDTSARTSAIIGFAIATAGLIITIVSLVGEISSAGTSSIGVGTGIKLVIAGVSVIAASAETIAAGYNAVKTFTSTDSFDIDWDNIDWDQVGVSAAQNAINYGSDGYMWGAIIGTVYGGGDGYDYYYRHGAPYSSLKARLDHTPVNGDRGRWSGERGNSDFILEEPIELADGTEITKVTYKNGIPDFSPYQEAQVRIPNMTDSRYNNFKQADEVLAEYWTRIRYNGESWTPRKVEEYRTNNNLTWHEMNNMESMQLVPHDVNSTFGHLGGVGEYNAMIGQEGVAEFD